jgi:hypothetical protein
MKNSSKINTPRLLVALSAAATLLTATAPAQGTASNRVITTPLHNYTLDDTGLPAQLEIRALTNDIPLAWRSEKKCPEPVLHRMGRGPQFALPMRLEAVIDKATVVAKADAPATLQKTEAGTEATATWQAGELKGRLRMVYGDQGVLSGQITLDAKGVSLDRLDLVLELTGPVDTAFAGNPVAAADKQALPAQFGKLSAEPGLLWSDGEKPSGDGSLSKGRIPYFFLGNGDRAFTWLPQGEEGFTLGGDEPSLSVERKREGSTVWRIALANKKPRSGEKTASFTLLIHPARPRLPGRRLEQWQPWAAEQAASPALDAAARGTLSGSNLLVRAETASLQETSVARTLLAGSAGGAALATTATLADRFPIGLFRYLAGTHTALGAQLRTDAATLTSAGASPAPDRMALGRALLHDIGLDVSTLANPVAAAAVVRQLEEFGCFLNDGQTEFLPYWRTTDILHYGEEAKAKDGFAVDAADPSARTYVSAFSRPDGVQKKRKALFILVNESTNAVRGQLYVQQPSYLFGGFNKLIVEDIYDQLTFSRIPEDSDWNRSQVLKTVPTLISQNCLTILKKGQNPAEAVPPLMDLESGGYVRLVERGDPGKKFGPAYKVKEQFEVYGPVHVPARGLRLLYGTGEHAAKQTYGGVTGSVVNRQTGKPLVATIHICSGTFARAEMPPTGDEKTPGARQLLAKLPTNKDGTIKTPGSAIRRFAVGSTMTVFAEVNGKFYPCALAARPSAAAPADQDASPSFSVEADKTGKTTWMNVLAEIDGPAGS